MLQDDVAVVRDTADILRRLHQVAMLPLYAEIFSPLHDDGVAELLRRNNVLLRVEELEADELEIVSPPVFGTYIMAVSSRLTPERRRFAIRHGLGHVVAGHVSELSFMSTTRDWHTHEERVADVFALADLLPFHVLDDLRKARTAWVAIIAAIRRCVQTHTLDWPTDRVGDRAELRLALYRQEGL